MDLLSEIEEFLAKNPKHDIVQRSAEERHAVSQQIQAIILRHNEAANAARNTSSIQALTRRERQCLTLVAAGCSSAEISDQLAINTRTVDWHISRCCDKLGAPNRVAAVARAIKNGQIGSNLQK